MLDLNKEDNEIVDYEREDEEPSEVSRENRNKRRIPTWVCLLTWE